MKKLIYSLTAALILSACSVNKSAPCENTICTMEFKMIQVKFNDASGNPLAVKDFTSINKRTGESTMQNNEPTTVNNRGIYTVASDADVKKLSEAGDIITISATHPGSNKKTDTKFVVAGGACACHINKISGPAEVTLQ
jgi:hypothetical protein